MKKIKKIFESIKLKWLRDRLLTVILIAILIAAFIGINLGVQVLNISDIDLTEEKIFTLTDESKEAISKIPEDEEITVYLFDYVEDTSLVDLAKQYTDVRKNIKIELTTVTEKPDLAQEYGISAGSYSILIIDGEKHKLINQTELSTFDYTTGNTIDITEQRLTNGIISVSSVGEILSVYMLTGHKEYSLASEMATFKQYLELENYELKELDLLISGKIPDDCETLIISSPKSDFTDSETNIIKKYINAGGNIVWFNDPYTQDDKMPNLQSILDMYGVTVDDKGIIVEQDETRMVSDNPTIIVPTVNYSEVTQDVYGNGLILLVQPVRLKFVSDEKLEELKVAKTDILTSSEKSFFRTKLDIQTYTATKDDEVGSNVLGAMLDKTVKDATEGEEAVVSSLVIYANNYFVSDAPVASGQQIIPAIYFCRSSDLALNTISYTAKASEGLVIRKNIENTYYTATQAQDTIIRVVVYGVPVLIIILGIVVWQIRRRKK